MALGYEHAQFESIPGNELNTPTLSTKAIFFPLITSKVDLNPDPMERDDELRNQNEPLPVLEEAHDPTKELELRAYPDSLGFLLKCVMGAPTTTAGNGVITDPDGVAIPTGAYRHVWTTPGLPAGLAPQTTQFQSSYADNSAHFKTKGAAVESLTIDSPAKGGSMVKVSGPAAYLVRGSDPALTPTYESLAVRPFTRAGLTLPTWLSGTGEHSDFGLKIDNPVEAWRSLGIASKFPDAMDKADGLLVFSGELPQRLLDADDYDALKTATAFAAVARWVNDSIIASAYPYKLYVSMPNCQYVGGGPDELSNKRRIGATFSWKATYGGSASATTTLCNATSSYS